MWRCCSSIRDGAAAQFRPCPELPAACAPACAAAAAGAGLMNRTRAVLRPGLFPLPLSCLLPGCLAGFAHLTVPWRIKRYD